MRHRSIDTGGSLLGRDESRAGRRADRRRRLRVPPEINHCWDFRIWLDIDPDTSVQPGAARDQDWAGSEAETIHRNRYLPAERLYTKEVDPMRLVDLVIDNSTFGQPRIIRG